MAYPFTHILLINANNIREGLPYITNKTDLVYEIFLVCNAAYGK